MPRKQREPLILTLDTETIGLDGELKRIAIYDGCTITYGYTFDDVLPEIESIYNDGYMPHIYIHNADFDLRKIPQIFERGNVIWSRTKIIGNKYARVQCKHYVIHDSLKLLPMSLAKASKDFDLEHGKLDLWDAVQKAYPNEYADHVDFLNRCDKDDKLYLEYLGYDVISLYELLHKLMEVSKIQQNDFVKLLSTASMSRWLFKNGWGDLQFSDGGTKTDFEKLTWCRAWSSEKTMKYTDKSYIEVEYLMRYGFYGGRTEVFTPFAKPRNGEVVAWHYDVNSLYPSVMALLRKLSGISVGLNYPIGYPEYEDDPRLARIVFENWMRDQIGLGFICADVFIPDQPIPPLPVKMEKLAFVCGEVSGCWTFTELLYAMHNCGVKIRKVNWAIYFQHTFPVFKRFVDCFYRLKEEGKRTGNSALTTFAKLIQNTAYGWTVLRRDDKTCFRDIKDIEKYEGTDQFIMKSEELGNIEIWDNVLTETIQVQVGAYVTSYARLVLLDALRKQAEVGNVYYCDTDSIVTDCQMPPEIVDPYALGLWDCEGELEYGLFLQPKVYTEKLVGGKLNKKFKGVSKGRQQELDYEFYENLYHLMRYGEKQKFRVETGATRMPSLVVAQKKGISANTLSIINKDINIGAAAKRIFDYEANTSKPYFFETLEQFQNFSFDEFQNPPDGENLYGG